MRRLLLAVAGLGLTFGVAGRAEADILAANLTTNGAFTINYFEGQSVTTPGGGPFNNITFNFYSNTVLPLQPSAPGTMFILNQGYHGSPAGLNSSTSGFIASSIATTNGVYQFSSNVTLNENTQYFFYANQSGPVTITPTDTYPGGQEWSTTGSNTAYGPAPDDTLFTLSGTAVSVVPEPSTAVVAVFGAVSGIAYGLARKRRAQRRQDQEGTSEQTQ